ncbi:hypothetical protein CEXT_216501 [Caerostris extrusa]|uniref:Uncharacterized protein n=1 Tax=Caerostris extrusa TaxID=172846 RepID=A0AAV4M563_CAEEX|nr:hypothetical protein CEXT_216501 [Caerostris extrusa]
MVLYQMCHEQIWLDSSLWISKGLGGHIPPESTSRSNLTLHPPFLSFFGGTDLMKYHMKELLGLTEVRTSYAVSGSNTAYWYQYTA